MKVKSLLVLTLLLTLSQSIAGFSTISFLQDWCNQHAENPANIQSSLVNRQSFFDMANLLIRTYYQKYRDSAWSDSSNPFAREDNPALAADGFNGFVQRVHLKEYDKALLFGDLHGNIHSLARTLSNLMKRGVIQDDFTLQKGYHLFFLGDFVDRGVYGVEILRALMILKLTNPDQVYLVRGNHEDLNQNEGDFIQELATKFPGINNQEIKTIGKFYNCLPPAIYLGIHTQTGVDYIQCCHGGLELGYNPKAFLNSPSAELQAIPRLDLKANQYVFDYTHDRKLRDCVKKLRGNLDPQDLKKAGECGFMWSDFDVDRGHTHYDDTSDRISYGKNVSYLTIRDQSSDTHPIRAIFRAHQHHGPMLDLLMEHAGMVSLYDGLVYTLLSAPLAGSDFMRDSLCLLTIGQSYHTSHLEHWVFFDQTAAQAAE